MNVYCKRQEAGTFGYIPEDWKVENLRCYDGWGGFIPIEDLDYHCPKYKHLYWIGVHTGDSRVMPGSLQEMCNILFKDLIYIGLVNFWLLYYYDFMAVSLLASEENYFKDDPDVVKITINRRSA